MKHIYYSSSCSLSTIVRFLHSWAARFTHFPTLYIVSEKPFLQDETGTLQKSAILRGKRAVGKDIRKGAWPMCPRSTYSCAEVPFPFLPTICSRALTLFPKILERSWPPLLATLSACWLRSCGRNEQVCDDYSIPRACSIHSPICHTLGGDPFSCVQTIFLCGATARLLRNVSICAGICGWVQVTTCIVAPSPCLPPGYFSFACSSGPFV